MRVLVTRPLEEARSFAQAIEARGHRALIEPLTKIERMALPVEAVAKQMQGAQGVVFTSVNGVKAFAGLIRIRPPAYCVGETTKEAAHKAGFETAFAAGGNAEALASLISQRVDPERGPLVHATGKDVARDLGTLLEPSGHTVRQLVVYDAVAVARLSQATAVALRAGGLDAVTLMSPRAGSLFFELANQLGLSRHLGRLTAICISPAVAQALPGVWKAKRAAEQPTVDGMLAAIDRVALSSQS